jgi:hypothetical protein
VFSEYLGDAIVFGATAWASSGRSTVFVTEATADLSSPRRP